VAGQLRDAQSVVILVCTVGNPIERLSLQYLESDPLHSLALYGVGSAAVESLSVAACHYFREQAAQQGLLTTIPITPGLEGWPIEQGQPEIFHIVNAAAIGVDLLPSFTMRPIKSTSLMIGMGTHIDTSGGICYFCSKYSVCAFQQENK